MRPELWAAAAALFALTLVNDAGIDRCLTTTSTRGWPSDPGELRVLANRCAAFSARTGSPRAAVTSAAAFVGLKDLTRARTVLSPFEDADNAEVLNLLAYLDSRDGLEEQAMEHDRRAAELARHWADSGPYVTAAGDLAYELLEANRFEEAIRVLDPLRQLPFDLSRYPRIFVVRALLRLGDLSAAEAEFQRLEALRGPRSPVLLELLAEGQLRLGRGQLRSAEQLLQSYLEESAAQGRKNHLTAALIYLVDVALADQDWALARRRIAAARSQAERRDELRDLAYRDGRAARESGQLEESLALLSEARTFAPDPTVNWRIENEAGKTLEQLGRRMEASAAYRQSIAEIETLRSTLHDAGLQAWLTESRREPYLALFELQAEQGLVREALETVERFLGSAFADQVAASSNEGAREPLEALDRGDAIRSVISAETSAQGLDRALELGRAPFVAFVEGRSKVWRVRQTASRTAIERLPSEGSELCEKARRLGETPDDDGLAAEVGTLLFGAGLPSGLGGRFALVLPRCARNLPFGAVRVGGRRLVDLAVVTAAPDLAIASGARRSPPARTGELVLGDPRGDLPAARQEAVEVGNQLGVQPLVGPDASVEALRRSPPLRLLHLATHTDADARGPALVLADGRLTVGDVLTSRLAPTLVVLASCRSGSIDAANARDTLASAFLRTGSHSVLATFRSVEDALAARVIEQFYASGGRDDPAAALTRVQRTLARVEPPSRWAVFFIAGSAEPLQRVSQVAAKAR